MRVGIVGEFSGRVRKAFADRGHDAWSCDRLPSWLPGNHVQEDYRDGFLYLGWDLLICFPSCTYLALSGIRWNVNNPVRKARTRAALNDVSLLLNAPVERISVENPIGVIPRYIRKYDQIIHPWMFGRGETKTTCLWLKNLPKLKPTAIVEGRAQVCFNRSPGEDRWMYRSLTYQGVADAMADQWGSLVW